MPAHLDIPRGWPGAQYIPDTQQVREGGRWALQEARVTKLVCHRAYRSPIGRQRQQIMWSVYQRETQGTRNTTPQGGPPNSARGRWSVHIVLEKRTHQ